MTIIEVLPDLLLIALALVMLGLGFELTSTTLLSKKYIPGIA